MSRRSLVIGGTCVHGHVLTEENTYKYPNGRLVCKVCRIDSVRKSQGQEHLIGTPIQTWSKDKTHCPQGHPYDEENTRHTTSGGRRCKTCDYNRNREKQFQDKYGLTVEQYQIMCLIQNNLCAICCEEPEENLHVDHDHVTGEVRGLLCNNCNNGLGRFKDNIESLENAILYLRASTN